MSHAPNVARREHHRPEWDRAAGALLGAAVAVLLTDADPAHITGLVGHRLPGVMDPRTTDPRDTGHLGRLLAAALARLTVEEHGGALPDAATSPAELAWGDAVRRTARHGGVPDPGEGHDHPATLGWRAVLDTPVPTLDAARRRFPCDHLVVAIHAAHRAAGPAAARYAGALAGARWGASGVPLALQRRLAATVPAHELVRAAVVAARGSRPTDWPEFPTLVDVMSSPPTRVPFAVPHPHDPGVELCNLVYARDLADAEAVVSLCRLGTADRPPGVAPRDRVEVWMHDWPGANHNLHFQLDQAAGAVAALRAEGRRVLLHCAAGQSRTPAVAAHYAASARGVDPVTALRAAVTAVGGHVDNPELARAVAQMHGVELPDPAVTLFPDGLNHIRRGVAGLEAS